MKNQTHYINIESINNIRQVINVLQKQTLVLPKTNIKQLAVFNAVYIVISKGFEYGLKTNLFEEPKKIEKLCIVFASYYFAAINEYYKTNSLPPVWLHVTKAKTKPEFIKLLLAANAHINYDLPQALNTKKLNISKTDYYAADRIFKNSVSEIIESFSETHTFYNFIKANFRVLYQRPLIAVIIHWRHRAWKNHLVIQNQKLSLSGLEKSSNQIANSLLDIF